MYKADLTITKGRRRAGNFFIFLTVLLLIGSAAAKFAGVPPVVAQLSADGFGGARLTFIAILEVASALLFLVPATRSLGLLLVSAFMGGAIATHLGHGQPFFQPAIFLFLVWLGAWLRHPLVLWSIATGRREVAANLVGSTANAVRQF